MSELVIMINYLGMFVKDAVLDVIPLGSILITSLTVGAVIERAKKRADGGK